ncbi:MAG: rhodanese-like domain-containing protein [Planctomycetota bacterium]
MGDELDARVEASVDKGRTFRPLVVSPPGPYLLEGRSTERKVTWDSMPVVGGGVFEILLRARARPNSRAGPMVSATIANYGFADAPDLADWALAGADPEELIVADAWSFENWAAGHLEGAISLPLDRILDEGSAALPYPRDRRLVFYCGGGT